MRAGGAPHKRPGHEQIVTSAVQSLTVEVVSLRDPADAVNQALDSIWTEI